MKNLYDNNTKTKSTMTQLRGLNHNIIYEKTEEEEEENKLRKIPVKHIEIQTELAIEDIEFQIIRRQSVYRKQSTSHNVEVDP